MKNFRKVTADDVSYESSQTLLWQFLCKGCWDYISVSIPDDNSDDTAARLNDVAVVVNPDGDLICPNCVAEFNALAITAANGGQQ
jgi:hypothetical protein